MAQSPRLSSAQRKALNNALGDRDASPALIEAIERALFLFRVRYQQPQHHRQLAAARVKKLIRHGTALLECLKPDDAGSLGTALKEHLYFVWPRILHDRQLPQPPNAALSQLGIDVVLALQEEGIPVQSGRIEVWDHGASSERPAVEVMYLVRTWADALVGRPRLKRTDTPDFTRRAIAAADLPQESLHALPSQQRIILEAIAGYERETGEPCPAAYLARRFRRHASTIHDHLVKLHRRGWLRTDHSPSRLARQLAEPCTESAS